MPHDSYDGLRLIGAIFAALCGLAFGSFLNVVLVRLPEDESIVSPASHCRDCGHALSWWENLPLLSWIALRGRCSRCRAWIGIRYPLIELAIAALWTICWFRFPLEFTSRNQISTHSLIVLLGNLVLCWLLVALSALDAENFWLPDALTLPGILLGLAYAILLKWSGSTAPHGVDWWGEIWPRIVEILIPAGMVLLIRLAYWLVRRKEGMGLGDAKLMAMLGAWLGLAGALESFAFAVFAASAAALIWIAISVIRGNWKDWANLPLPLGTFLCLAALSEIFYPAWLWNWWSARFWSFQ
jgi:leader peptidase (prepilin peptidase)/N-methyltransferase